MSTPLETSFRRSLRCGAKFLGLAELMHSGDALPLLDHSAPISDVLLSMTSKGFGVAIVTKDGRLADVITDGDLRRNMDNLMGCRAADIANTTPTVIAPECLAPEALALMNARKISVLVIVDAANIPVGILHIHDLLRAGVV